MADPKKHYTKAFSQEVIRKVKKMTVSDVADAYALSWGTIDSIQKECQKK
ncbi:MAG: transposase family protein [Deltaproteobacteria bacterium]|nr:transposase family protein [Deltaproteobacteria bacterium]